MSREFELLVLYGGTNSGTVPHDRSMSSPAILLSVLRAELKRVGITYAVLAQRIGVSESSVKRMFSRHDMTLTRLAEICRAAGVGFDDLMRRAADAAPQTERLTQEQEESLIADPRLLLVAICCLGQWTLEQMVQTYEISEAQCVHCLAQLDRLRIIELRPLNRYRLRVARAFRWRPDGPVQNFFRTQVIDDYFAGRFDGSGEALLCVNGRLSVASAEDLVQRIGLLAESLARHHQDDQRLPSASRDGYTLVVGLRSWELAAFTRMRRDAVDAPRATVTPSRRRMD